MRIDWRHHRSFLSGTWEQAVVDKLILNTRPGDTVLDIGAHIGFYTLLLAKLVGPSGRVFAFEPIPDTFRILSENVHLNHFEHVTLVNRAVLDRPGCFNVRITDEELLPGSVPLSHDTGTREVEVEAVRLDDALRGAGPIRLVKMDVEGAEEHVLCGALRTIEQFHPQLLIELHHLDGRPQAHPVPPLLESLGYKIEWLDRWQWTSHIWATWPASSKPLDAPRNETPAL
jgi:FkbM family methyltransferase